MDDPTSPRISISLPPAYTTGAPPTRATLEQYLAHLASLLQSPLARALVQPENHPNRLTTLGDEKLPEASKKVWDWSAGVQKQEREKVLGELAGGTLLEVPGCQPPEIIRSLLHELDRLRLPREARRPPARNGCGSSIKPPNNQRKQSPKKIHEVERLSEVIGGLAKRNQTVHKVVDVGAGQGYLSRSLSRPPYDLAVLAIDGEEHQTSGATAHLSRSRATTKSEAGSLRHVTAHIGDHTSLSRVVSQWVASEDTALPTPVPVPVALVGLHACGPLTVSVLRAFVAELSPERSKFWTPSALVLVGCCYNKLMRDEDLRVSSMARKVVGEGFWLPDHLQLATRDWLHVQSSVSSSIATWPSTSPLRLALRRLSRWAILDDLLASSSYGPAGIRRLGPISATAIQASWPDFVRIAAGLESKLGLDVEQLVERLEKEKGEEEERERKEFQLTVLFLLRFLLGPAIEAYILIDRCLWLLEQPEIFAGSSSSGNGWTVALESVFDRSKGSLRNMAIIIEHDP